MPRKQANTKSIYVAITPQNAKRNPAYNLVFMPQFREQAARIIQQFVRKYKLKNNRVVKYEKTIKGPLTLNFIKEPLGDNYLTYGEKISLGKWLDLDFANQDFERNLYKAFRLNDVNSNQGISVQQLGTALLLSHAHQFFAEEKSSAAIEQYSYDDKDGPYDIMDIHYANKLEIQNDLQRRLRALPDNEKVYFTIELSEEHAIDFLYNCISVGMTGTMLSKFKTILQKFIENKMLEAELQEKLINYTHSLTENPESEHLRKEAPAAKIMLFLQSLKKQKISSIDMRFMALGLRLDAQAPNIEFSKKNKIVLIIQNYRMYEEMLRAMHGKDASIPLYTAGQFSPLYMRQADEGTLTYFQGSQYRPVELMHPDLIPTELQHEMKVHAFSATWHDMFYHLMRNSANPWKPLVREIRKLLQEEKRVLMNKIMWSLIDMDYSQATEWRLTHDKEGVSKNLISRIWRFLMPGTTHENLLGIAILLKHHAMWEKMLGMNPVEAILETNKNDRVSLEGPIKKMQAYLDADTDNANKLLSPTYYVLRFILGDVENAEELAKKVVATNIVSWQRNGGLQISAKYSGNKKPFALEEYQMSERGIANTLTQALTRYEKDNLIDVKTTKPEDISESKEDRQLQAPKKHFQFISNNNLPREEKIIDSNRQNRSLFNLSRCILL